MGGACSMYGGQESACRVLVGRPDVKQGLVVGGRVILKWIFEKWDGETWTGLIWLGIKTGGGRF